MPFDAPEVVVAAEGDEEKLDPTRKAVIYGGVVEEAVAGSYDLEWTQVRGRDAVGVLPTFFRL